MRVPTMNKAQQTALWSIYCRDNKQPTLQGYRAFRRKAVYSFGCFMVPWCNMWLGIEPDGYTHS